MDVEGYLRFVLALVFVLGLIGLLGWAARRYGLGGRIATPAGGARRLHVVEAVGIDAKHRLVLVRRDGTEHLLLVGGPNDLVIETGIEAGGVPANDPGPGPKPSENVS